MPSDKKRKRDSTPKGPPAPDIAVTTAPSGDFPPILVTTHGITLPQSIPLQPYTCVTAPPASSKRHRRAEYLLHGSTPRIDYEGREYPEDSEYHRYYIGIFDPATNSVELHVAPKVHFSRTIKQHAERDNEIDEKGVLLNNADSRAVLGRQFGTRKAKKALLSREMNRIDVSDMDSTLTTSIISQVGEATKSIPTTAQLGAQLLEARPIPPPNKDAIRPEDVYNLDDVISAEEWDALWVREWEKGEVGGIRSSYVRTRVTRLHASREAQATASKAHSKSLKILKYILHLIEFYQFQFRGRGRLPAMERAKKALGIDQVLVESFFGRFADKTASGEGGVDRWAVSPGLANKCLYYLAVLCLMVDCWEVDLYELKLDLGLTTRELVVAFKGVGCSFKELSKTQCLALKMSKAEATQHRKAILKIPLEFPSAPRRKAVQKGRM